MLSGSVREQTTDRDQPRRSGERRRGIALGAIAGTIGLACCVAPAAAALIGISSAAAAIDLGNRLYSDWGWAFKGAAVLFAVAALIAQRRRAATCPIDERDRRPDLMRLAIWLVGTGVATYGLLYGITRGLELLA